MINVDLTAAETTVALVDGIETEVWAYNGTVPGPALRVDLGDTIRVNVRNDLDAATTIHWHGIRVPNDMDGVPDVNQPRIEPGATFVYEFTPPDAGTYWYHSHTDGSQQLERGLYGSIVVNDPGDGTDYDVERVYDGRTAAARRVHDRVGARKPRAPRAAPRARAPPDVRRTTRESM